MKGKIYKYFATTRNFEIPLQDLITSYNNQWHRSLPDNMSPVQVPLHKEQVYDHLYGKRWIACKNMRFTFSLGEKVRIAKLQDKFDKGYKLSNWSASVYTIKVFFAIHLSHNMLKNFQKRVPSRPPRYKVESDTGILLDGSFYAQELLAVPKETKSQTLFKVKKIMRHRRNRATGEEEVLIQFDSPGRHLEWLSKAVLDNGSIV